MDIRLRNPDNPGVLQLTARATSTRHRLQRIVAQQGALIPSLEPNSPCRPQHRSAKVSRSRQAFRRDDAQLSGVLRAASPDV